MPSGAALKDLGRAHKLRVVRVERLNKEVGPGETNVGPTDRATPSTPYIVPPEQKVPAMPSCQDSGHSAGTRAGASWEQLDDASKLNPRNSVKCGDPSMAKPSAAATATARTTAEEIKTEIRRLVRAIEGDGRIETLKEAARALGAVTDRLGRRGGGGGTPKKPSPLSPRPEEKRDEEAVEVPEHFLCPISSEIMKDPVVLATGETYDRRFIEEWLSSGNRSCPRTQQILSDLRLTPNKSLRRLIHQWCSDKGVPVPPPVDETGGSPITRSDRNRLNALLARIWSSTSVDEKKEAIGELRQLTKLHSSYRAMMGENPDAIVKLLSAVSESALKDDSELREDTVTVILNLSIYDSNKKVIAETAKVIPFLIESLGIGTMESRRNAAAALFTLSAVDSNKTKIGDLGAMRPLVDLLEQGSWAAKRDAASAVFNLIMAHENRGRAVREGVVEVLLRCIADGSLVDEALAVLAMLSGDQEAVEEVADCGGVGCLLRVLRESECWRSRENAVVVLFSVCVNDRTKMREVREEEGANGTITRVSQSGTSRARRKATGILERLRRTALNTHYSC